MKYLVYFILLLIIVMEAGCVTVNQQFSPTPTPQIIYMTVQVTPTSTQIPTAETWILTETLQVPSRGTAAPDYKTVPAFSSPVKKGAVYKIQASGTYIYGNTVSWGIADAEWSNRKGNPVPGQVNGTWYKGDAMEPWLDLMINEMDADWGNFQPNHVYTKMITGDGKPLSFRIKDRASIDEKEGSYDDNDGYLTIDIFQKVTGTPGYPGNT